MRLYIDYLWIESQWQRSGIRDQRSWIRGQNDADLCISPASHIAGNEKSFRAISPEALFRSLITEA
jgi:hypothetical protein